jgi:hypothetical protein
LEDKRRVWKSFKDEVLDRLSSDDGSEQLKALRISRVPRQKIHSSVDSGYDEVSRFKQQLSHSNFKCNASIIIVYE